jgi:hypothetical protein
LNNGHIKDILCVPNLSCNILLIYQITHSGEGKSVLFTPHQVLVQNLKDPQHIVATRSVDDITRLYKFENFRSSSLPLVFFDHSDDVRRLWHASTPLQLVHNDLCGPLPAVFFSSF